MADPTPRASTLKSGSVDLVESLDPAAAYVKGFVGAGNRVEVLSSVWLDK
jgi:hypothetical protein